MPMHPHAQPNFRNLFWYPFKVTMITALRTFPIIGKRFSWGYHNTLAPQVLDEGSKARVEANVEFNDVSKHAHQYAADREASDLVPSVWRPQTILYPYERLEDMEPWLFVPGNYNGRIGVIWETCTACKLCVSACPNDCLHMTTELRVDVLDSAEGEHEGFGADLEVGGWAAVEIEGVAEEQASFNLATAHDDVPESWRFGEVLDLSGDTVTVRWNDSGEEEVVGREGVHTADDQIVSGRIDLGRCMFCGLCMEACGFTSFFMTNEYDGMSGFTRQDLWFDASRTRVLPSVHQEAVDAELAKRANKERDKRAKAAARAWPTPSPRISKMTSALEDQAEDSSPGSSAREMDLGAVAETAVFFFFATAALAGSYGLIKAQKVAHSMLFVIFAFLAIAGIFILLGAEFLAAIQILVYIASVGLVVLFGIMLTRRQILEEDFE